MKVYKHPAIQGIQVVWITVCLLFQGTVNRFLISQSCSNSKACRVFENPFSEWLHPVLESKAFWSCSFWKLYSRKGISDGSWQCKMGNLLCFLIHKDIFCF